MAPLKEGPVSPEGPVLNEVPLDLRPTEFRFRFRRRNCRFVSFGPVSFLVFSFLAQFRFRPSFVFGPSSFSAQSETEVSFRLLENVPNLCVHPLNRARLGGVSPVG